MIWQTVCWGLDYLCKFNNLDAEYIEYVNVIRMNIMINKFKFKDILSLI